MMKKQILQLTVIVLACAFSFTSCSDGGPASDGTKLGKKACALSKARKDGDEKKVEKLQEELTKMGEDLEKKYKDKKDDKKAEEAFEKAYEKELENCK